MNYSEIFPTVIGITEVTTKIPEELKSLEACKSIGNERSINSYVLDKYETLKEELEYHANEYFKEVFNPKSKDNHIYITQSWMNYTNSGGFHHKHFHPNSFLSGVLYIDVNEQDSISFVKRTTELLQIEPKSYNRYNSSEAFFNVANNSLVLFSSLLFHEVCGTNNKNRISLAFNTFIKGTIGSDQGLAELKL